MDKSDSLKAIERMAYRLTLEDGFYDIAIGLAFIILALIPALKSHGIPGFYGYLILIIPALLPWPAKRLITIPRLGAVEFGSKRRARRWRLLIIATTFLFLTMPIIFSIWAGRSQESSRVAIGLPLIVSLIAPPVMLLAAYFLDYTRLCIYAAALLVAIPYAVILGRAMGLSLGIMTGFGLLGAAILVYGIILLARFMKKFPKSPGEDYNAA